MISNKIFWYISRRECQILTEMEEINCILTMIQFHSKTRTYTIQIAEKNLHGGLYAVKVTLIIQIKE